MGDRSDLDAGDGLRFEDRKYWVGFNLVKGIGAVRLKRLLMFFGDAQSAWEASPTALRDAGLSQKLTQKVLQTRQSLILERVWESLFEKDIQVLTWLDATYPPLLKEINQPPPVVYLRGKFEEEDVWAVAIVGTRRLTAYGRQVAQDLAAQFAYNGVTVVSGLARGVDTVAHEAALRAGGRTLAVLGSGVDRIYPPENRVLASRICQSGVLLSDYPPGTPPEGENFPPRNRIISGLSRAVVVVEAGTKSGALITASFAVDQGREVFAVPGSIMAPRSQGTNRLICQGARPLLKPVEVLEALNHTRIVEQQSARMVLPSDPVELQIYNLMSAEPVHIDEISDESHLSIDKVSATLAMMELKGMVRHVGGMRYMVIRDSALEYQVEKK